MPENIPLMLICLIFWVSQAEGKGSRSSRPFQRDALHVTMVVLEVLKNTGGNMSCIETSQSGSYSRGYLNYRARAYAVE